MEVAYSVGVSNRFASLMADDDDPGDEVITPTNAPEKVERDKKKDVKGGKPKVKDNREKAQQMRKSVQDSTKREQCHVYATDRLSDTHQDYLCKVGVPQFPVRNASGMQYIRATNTPM